MYRATAVIESPQTTVAVQNQPMAAALSETQRRVLVALCLRGLLEKFGGTSLPQNHKRLQRDL
jgi:hypothetical protein